MRQLIIRITEKLYHRPSCLFLAVYCGAAFLCILNLYEIQIKDKGQQNQISFLDVGQGDSTFIQSSEGHRLMIDAGDLNTQSADEIKKLIPWYSKRIDVAIATHADLDHIGGFTKVLNIFHVGRFLTSPIRTTKSVESDLNESIEIAGVATSTISRGARITLGTSGIFIDILYPSQFMKINSDKDTNLFSIVAMVSIASSTNPASIKKFVLTGDAPQESELMMVKQGDDLRADVLKAGHHGSRTSTSQEFLDAIRPSSAIISAGLRNKYGHPHVEVIEKLKNENVRILETSKLGTITLY